MATTSVPDAITSPVGVGASGQKVLRDPTTSTSHEPVYPLSQDNLQDILEYDTTFGGEVTVLSKINLPAGSHLCYVTTQTAAPVTTWSSIQSSKTTHFELNNALVYSNHSCMPTIDVRVFAPDTDGNYPNGIAAECLVTGNRDLKVGDELKWFYPSTEWASPRPFKCLCGAPDTVCIRDQRGSSFLTKEILEKYFLNHHVRELMHERDQGQV